MLLAEAITTASWDEAVEYLVVEEGLVIKRVSSLKLAGVGSRVFSM